MSARCTVEGCTRDARSRKATLCNAHYFRQYRTGSTGGPEISGRQQTPCAVDDCNRPRGSVEGFCNTHARRWRKHGTTDPVSNLRYGPENPSWRGDDASYADAHERVRRARGRAKEHACIDCGGQARHWSYNHQDPNEKRSPKGCPYSLDLTLYDPRCVPCHKKFDLALIASTGGALGAARREGRRVAVA